MEYIYHKFIKPGAVHEVNLSHGVRSPLRRFFDRDRAHLSHGKVESLIFNVFDEAALQILELMVDSFGRFASTKTCRQIQKEMDAAVAQEDSTGGSRLLVPQSRLGRSYDGDDVSIGSATTTTRGPELPVVRHAASLGRVMHRYEITSCGGLIRAEDLEKEMGLDYE